MTAVINAICHHLPTGILTNEMLAQAFTHSSAAEIYRTCGIRQRHIAAPTETPADLAYYAAEKLFKQQPDTRQQIDALLFCSEGLDYKAPATACLLHQRLSLKPSCLSLDIPGGCTGFVNGLQVAKSLIAGNPNIHQVLLLTAETASKVLHPEDLHLRMLFGDGACATLVSRSEQRRIGEFVAGTDGSRAQALWIEHSATRFPANLDWLAAHQHTANGMAYGRLLMDGAELLHFSLSRVPNLVQDTLTANALTGVDIDLYVFHQASKIILKSLQRKCRIPDSKFASHYDMLGNTVSSTIPLVLEAALGAGRIGRGQKIMLVGFGIGLSWNATLIEI